jgi:hypothetical protein
LGVCAGVLIAACEITEDDLREELERDGMKMVAIRRSANGRLTYTAVTGDGRCSGSRTQLSSSDACVTLGEVRSELAGSGHTDVRIEDTDRGFRYTAKRGGEICTGERTVDDVGGKGRSDQCERPEAGQ